MGVAHLYAFDQHLAATAVEHGFSSSPTDSDGILGMAYQALSSLKAPPFFSTLYAQGHVWQNLFSFYFSPTGSELILGGTDWSKFIHPLTFTPVTQQAVSDIGPGLLKLPIDPLEYAATVLHGHAYCLPQR